MAQTPKGAMKSAAKNAGMTFFEFQQKIEAGLKRCTKCKSWRDKALFCSDKSRGDGLGSTCQLCRRVKERKNTKGRVSTFKGRTHTEEAKHLLSEKIKALGQRHRLGQTHSLETRKKISETRRAKNYSGEHCHSYKDGKLAERRGERFSMNYKRWRFDVFMRDKFTCQECGDARGGNLNAHHLKPFADFPELRFSVDNGLTLCEQCHKAKHRIGV